MKRRITFNVDGEGTFKFTVRRGGGIMHDNGLDIENVEDIPEPNRVQEFRVRITTHPSYNPWSATRLYYVIDLGGPGKVTVTEVEVTKC